MALPIDDLLRDFPRDIPPDRPILIAGPTASGKSTLALALAETRGGVVVNADASQVYGCWRIITARPTAAEEARAPHALYGHVGHDAEYSAGHWIADVARVLGTGARPIIVGGTGLYFAALTEGLADIPKTPPQVRALGDRMPLDELVSALDPATRDRIDTRNRARVQRAWEVLRTSGRGLAHWQDSTPAPLLPLSQTVPFVMDAPRDWLTPRIERRFDAMIAAGALEEVERMAEHHDPALPAFRAIGVPELHAHLNGDLSLDAARDRVTIATRQYAKRQRTWFRKRCAHWHRIRATDAFGGTVGP